MTVESIIKRILAARKDLTHEEVLKMIEEKIKSAKGYFTEEIAARIVASELGIKTAQKRLPEISIKNLVSGLNDVTITGRVIHVFPTQRFTRMDETEGFFKRLIIADKSGEIKVVLWNDKAKLADTIGIKPGNIVKFSHGYVREGLDGKAELNMGNRGEIEILPDEMSDEYPSIEKFIKKINKITGKDRNANVLGIVQQVSSESKFKKKDGSEGKTKWIMLRDSTGQIRVVFWNNKADEIKTLKKGNYLRIMNAKVRTRIDGQPELHVERGSSIEILTEKPSGSNSLPSIYTKIKEITQGMRNIDILARVIGVGEVRELNRQTTKYYSQLLIKDETGSIQLNLWGDKALLSKKIKPGDTVLIEGANAQRRFGKISLNLDNKGSITINPKVKEAENLPDFTEEITKIKNAKEGECITVQGTVLTSPSLREITTTRNERVKVASFELSDDTGKIKVSLWRKLAEAAETISVGDLIKIRNIFVRKDMLGELSLSSGMLTSLEKILINKNQE